MSAAAVEAVALDEKAARALTDQIRGTLTVAHSLIIDAYQGRAWLAMGYATWDGYREAEFSNARLIRLQPAERRQIVAEMIAAGMSNRTAAGVLGVSEITARRDRAATNVAPPEDETREIESFVCPRCGDEWGTVDQAGNGLCVECDRVEVFATVTDEHFEDALTEARAEGDLSQQNVAAKVAAGTARRKPITDALRDATYDLGKITERLGRLAGDDRVSKHREGGGLERYRADTLRAIAVLTDVAERLGDQAGGIMSADLFPPRILGVDGKPRSGGRRSLRRANSIPWPSGGAGVSREQVRRDAAVGNPTPAPTRGLDGKSYQPRQQARPRVMRAGHCPACGAEAPTYTLPADVAAIVRDGRRRRYGRSVATAAAVAGVRADHFRRIERGAVRPSTTVAQAIADALELTGDDAEQLLTHAAAGRGRDRQVAA